MKRSVVAHATARAPGRDSNNEKKKKNQQKQKKKPKKKPKTKKKKIGSRQLLEEVSSQLVNDRQHCSGIVCAVARVMSACPVRAHTRHCVSIAALLLQSISSQLPFGLVLQGGLNTEA